MKNLAIGVDIGGSHISCMAFDLQNKTLLDSTFSQKEVDNHAESEEIIEAWAEAIDQSMRLAGRENIQGIGFAMPGPFDYLNGISLFTGQNGKFENTYKLNVSEEIRKSLELPADFKLRYINDATAFAIGEDQTGQAKNYNRSLSITLGTGFGSAFIIDKTPIVDGDLVPKEGCLWHLPFENGIADDYFSTRGLIRRFKDISGKQTSGVKEIADLASKDQQALELFNDFGRKMGIFLQPWIESSELEILVLGGNISKAFSLFQGELNNSLKSHGLEIAVSDLKEKAALIGSATLINDEFYSMVEHAIKKM